MSRNFSLGTFLVLLVLLCTAPINAAVAGASSDIVGEWELRTGEDVLRFVFAASGGGNLNRIPFQWTFRDGALDITMEDERSSYRARIAGNELHLSGGDLDTELVLRRPGGASLNALRSEAPETSLHGKWRAPDGSIIEFRPDGAGTNRRTEFRYTTSDGLLVFEDGVSSVLLAYRIEGDALALSSGSEEATFVRAGPGATVTSRAPAERKRMVSVNRTRLQESEIQKLEAQFQVRVLGGNYWYDAACGAWGLEGGPCMGFLPAKLALGGVLPADISTGGTGVFVNGRELHPIDVASLQRLTLVQSGRYWLDALGNCGYEGSPIPVLNLVQLANAARASSGGSYHSRSDITGIGSGGNGRTSYVMGKDWSVVIGE